MPAKVKGASDHRGGRQLGHRFAAWVSRICPTPLALTPTFDTIGNFDLGNVFTVLGTLTALLTIFSFMLTDFFDTMGTATAIGEQAGLIDEDGRLPDVGKMLLVDSVGAAVGGAAGVSSNTSYIESSAGVAEGGRTGLTAVVVGVLLPAVDLRDAVGLDRAVFGYCAGADPHRVPDGRSDQRHRLLRHGRGFPALLAIVLMPLTYSITVGIGAGFVLHVLIKLVKGKASQVPLLMWIVAGAFVIFFAQSLLGTAISA